MSGDPWDYLQDAWRDIQAPYDGVRGELPDWIPENFHREFHAIRSRLQTYSHDYSYDDLLGFVAAVRDMWERNEIVYNLAVPDEIYQEIITLAHFQEAARRGKEAGLALLTDPDHAGQAIQGKKFRDGRKPGTISPVRKFIRAALKKNPASTNNELWDAIVKRPPKGWTPIESPRLGRYIERPRPAGNVGWARFRNIAAEERKR